MLVVSCLRGLLCDFFALLKKRKANHANNRHQHVTVSVNFINMRDNKPIENEAVDYIKNRLAKCNINFAEPNFDKKGSDLLALKKVDEYTYKFLTIQAKGRTIFEKASSVVIPVEYIQEDFVVFIYIKTESKTDDYLYCFFYEELSKWIVKNEKAILSIPPDFKDVQYFTENEWRDSVIKNIETKLHNTNSEINQTLRFDSEYSTLESLLELWRTYHIPIHTNIIKSIYEDFDLSRILIRHQAFILYSYLKQSFNDEINFGFDHLFWDFKMSANRFSKLEVTLYEYIPTCMDWFITYRKSSVGEIVDPESEDIIGFYFALGDNEEEVQVAVYNNDEVDIAHIFYK